MTPAFNSAGLPLLGLYQHFKGAYYFLYTFCRDSQTDCRDYVAVYFNVMQPEKGQFTRPVDQWFSDVSDRPDNVTGQKTRFRRVTSLENTISIKDAVLNLSTDRLCRELSVREDSPIASLDIPGLTSQIAAVDYVVGQYLEGDNEVPAGVHTIVGYSDLKHAQSWLATHKCDPNTAVYKRTFIKVD